MEVRKWLTKKVADQKVASKEEVPYVEEKKFVYSAEKKVTQ